MRSVATKSNVSPRSKTSRTFPLRSFWMPGRSTIDCASVCITILCHGWTDRQTLDLDFFKRRISQANDYRDRRKIDPTLRRIVWSESDGLPGVILDRYGDYFVLQTLTMAMDLRRPLLIAAIVDLFGWRTIIE